MNLPLLPSPVRRGILLSMRRFLFIFLAVMVSLFNVPAQTPEDIASDWEKWRISNVLPSDTRHSDVKRYLDEIRKLGIKVEQVGVSNANREIYQMEWGSGPLKVFMWSQMHGDEPTATPALVDLFAFLQKNSDRADVKLIAEKITIRAVPMLNPDGAELFIRRNLQGIDINRDAINLATPEARILKRLRDDWNPAIGFNLHNQQELTTAGNAPRQAAISFLVVYGDPEKTTNAGHERNMRLASAMTRALQRFIPGHIGRYSDEWTPTAFGDNFSAWGTPTILIETGGLHGRDEMFLVKMNFVAFMTALNALATGSEANESTAPYLSLPLNGSGILAHVIFRNATVVNAGKPANGESVIVAVRQRRRASFAPLLTIASVARDTRLVGLSEYNAAGYYVVQRFGRTREGELAELLFYKVGRDIDWSSPDLEKEFPPDAVFSGGRFIKGGLPAIR